jgi:hypothetical protein
VFAVGKWSVFWSLLIQILGFIDEKPRVGGREQDVMKRSNNDFCSGVN